MKEVTVTKSLINIVTSPLFFMGYVLIILKLCNVLDINWLAATMPLWIAPASIALFLLGSIVVATLHVVTDLVKTFMEQSKK